MFFSIPVFLTISPTERLDSARRGLRSFLSSWSELERDLELERSVLSAFVVKNHNRFRNDKGFRDLVLALKCLSKLQEVRLDKVVGEILEDLPLLRAAKQKEERVYLPTEPMGRHACLR